MATTIELITRSTKTGAETKSSHRSGGSVAATGQSIYDIRVDGNPIPKGTKLTRVGSKLRFTFPDGDTFELNEWCSVADSKFAELAGALGYMESTKGFVDVQAADSGECKLVTSADGSSGALGSPSEVSFSPMLGGLALLGALAGGGGGGGGGGSSAGAAGPGTPLTKLAPGNASSAEGNLTASNKPTLVGKSGAGDTVTITLPTGEVMTTVADAQGDWSVTPTTALPDGEQAITVVASNGGVSSTPIVVTITVDTTAPSAPSITAISEESDGMISDTESADGTVVDLSLVDTGARAGDTVNLNWGGQVIHQVLTAADIEAGTIAITVPAAIIEAVGNGEVPVSVSLTDVVGNAGASGAETTATVVLGAPSTAPDLTAGSDSGTLDNDNITSQASPGFQIESPLAGYTAVLLVNGIVVPSHVVSTPGEPDQLVPDTPFTDGTYSIAVAWLDGAGVQSPASPAINITVDTALPDDASASPALTANSDTGNSNSDLITGDDTPSFTITAPPTGSTPQLYIDGLLVDSVFDPLTLQISPVGPVAPGVHAFTFNFVDLAGNEGAQSTEQAVTIVAPPAAPAGQPDLSTASDSGSNNTDNDTNIDLPVLEIAAPAGGLTPQLYVDGVAVASTFNPLTNQLEPSDPLVDGTYVLSYTLVDTNGIEGAPSPGLTITIDTTAPDTPSTAPDLATSSDTGSSNSDDVTGDSTPSIVIPALANGDYPTLYVDGVAVAANWDALTQTLTPVAALPPGDYSITYTVSDANGNESAASPALSITLQAAPTAPAAAIDLQSASDSGASNSDNITNVVAPVLQIPAPALGLTPTLYIDGVASNASFNALTNTFTLPANFAQGSYSLTYTLTNVSGVESGASPALALNVMTALPGAPSAAPDMTAATDSGSSTTDNITADTTPSFAVPALTVGQSARLYVDGVAVAATWDSVNNTLTPTTPLADGVYSITSTVVDAAGNESLQGAALTADIRTTTSAPSSAPDMLAATDSGVSNSDNITADSTPDFVVPAPGVGEQARLYVDGLLVASTWNALTNTLTPNVALSAGDHVITSTLVGAGGVESAASAALNVTVQAAPATPASIVDLQSASDSGASNSDNITNVVAPVLQIPAPAAGLTPTLYIDGAASSATFDTLTNTFTLPANLSQGSYVLTYTLTNISGVESAASAGLTIDIVTALPTAPTAAPDMTTATDSGSSATDNITADATPSFTVPALTAGQTARLYVDGIAVAATWDSVNNTLTPTTALADGIRTITSTVVDAAGNESLQGAALSADIRAATAAPTSAPDMLAASDSGASSTDNTTSNSTPEFVVPALGVGETARLYVDGIQVTATWNALTNTLTPTDPLDPGSHTITSTVVDAAGIESLTSAPLAVVIDQSGPAIASSSPADNATGAIPGSTLTLTFNDTLLAGTANQTITLYNFSTGVAVETFNVSTGVGSNGGTLSLSGATATLNLGTPLAEGTHYDIQMQSGAFQDAAGNASAAISTNSALDFTTMSVSVTNLASATYSKYLHSTNPNLVNTNSLGYVPGTSNFGSAYFTSQDDNSASVSITSAFSGGLNWFGTNYTNVGIGSNGYITFGHLNNSYTAEGIPGYTAGGMIAVQYDDWYSRAHSIVSTPGGTSLGTDNTYFAAYQNAGYGVVTLTFDDVGYFAAAAPGATDGLTTNNYGMGNAEQIRLVGTANGDIVIQLVYESVNWVNGNTGFPTAGWTAGDQATYGTVDGNVAGASSGGLSGTVNFLDVESTSNVGIAGVWEWVIGNDGRVGSGSVPMLDVHDTASAHLVAELNATGGTASYAQDPVLWDSRFTLVGNQVQSNAGAVFGPNEGSATMTVVVTDTATGLSITQDVTIALFDRFGGAGNDLIGLRDATGISELTSAVASQVVMNGGAGQDSLVFAGTGLTLDLTAVQNSALINVEMVDLGSNNTLTLALADVFAMSSADQFNSANGWVGMPGSVSAEQLVIDGTSTATLNVANSGAYAGQWTTVAAGTTTHGGHTYNIYNSTAGTGQLLIDQNVQLIFA
jgi:Bacterial Ig-like domain